MKAFGPLVLSVILMVSYLASAETVPHVFDQGSVVRSAEMNENFESLDQRLNWLLRLVPRRHYLDTNGVQVGYPTRLRPPDGYFDYVDMQLFSAVGLVTFEIEIRKSGVVPILPSGNIGPFFESSDCTGTPWFEAPRLRTPPDPEDWFLPHVPGRHFNVMHENCDVLTDGCMNVYMYDTSEPPVPLPIRSRLNILELAGRECVLSSGSDRHVYLGQVIGEIHSAHPPPYRMVLLDGRCFQGEGGGRYCVR